MKTLLEAKIYGNTISAYLLVLFYIVFGAIAIWVIKRFVLVHLKYVAKKTKTVFDDAIINMLDKNIIPPLYYGVFYLSIINLSLNEPIKFIIKLGGATVLTFCGLRFLTGVITLAIKTAYLKKEKDEKKVEGLKGILTFVKISIWTVGVLTILDYMGYPVKTAIAGLGIGGIAIAIASQAILGDLFSYFAIFFDKPFEVGDFIIVDDFLGTVEKVGIKTTRITSLSGEQLIFSNTDLTNSRIRNYKRMQKRRVVFKFGIIYQTPLEKIKEIPNIIKSIIESIDDTIFDRAHFFSFGPSSLDFEVVYYVKGNDYNKYMDIQQAINQKMVEIFREKEIEFAYPTQTIYLNQEEN